MEIRIIKNYIDKENRDREIKKIINRVYNEV